MFVTIEDETGDVQLILWPGVFAQCRAKLRSRVIQAASQVSRWDGTTNIIVSGIETIDTRVHMPAAHDWRLRSLPCAGLREHLQQVHT